MILSPLTFLNPRHKLNTHIPFCGPRQEVISPCSSTVVFPSYDGPQAPAVRIWRTMLYLLSFPGSSAGKESASNAGDLSSIPGSERSPGGEHGNPFHYSCLENPHGKRSLAGDSPWSQRVGFDWPTKHSAAERFYCMWRTTGTSRTILSSKC